MKANFREHTHLPISTEHLLEGRTVAKWLIDNMYRISKEDFYNQSLSIEDLQNKYGETNHYHNTNNLNWKTMPSVIFIDIFKPEFIDEKINLWYQYFLSSMKK